MSTIKIQKIGITKLDVDAIVNAANDGLWEGGGVCGAIFHDAGSTELTKACNAIGHCDTGKAVITPGFNLKSKYIIHAVGPVYRDGKHREKELLYGAYASSLKLAKENGCHSIGFPLISSGIFGYPKEQAFSVAIEACRDFLKDNSYEIDIIFAVLDDKVMAIGQDILNQSKQLATDENPFAGMIELIPILRLVDENNVDDALHAIHKAYFVFRDKNIPEYEIGFFPDRIKEFTSRLGINESEIYRVDPSRLDARDTIFLLALSFSMGRWDDGMAFKEMLIDGTVARWIERLDEISTNPVKSSEAKDMPKSLRKSTPEDRIKIFHDTLDMIETSSELGKSVNATKKSTKIFYENEYPNFDLSRTFETKITVSKKRSYQAAMDLKAENPNIRIAVMNFANAFHAGGGVTKGSSAQEECLCRTSTLYPCIYRRTLRDTFYKHHKDLNDPKATDSLVYTPGIKIIKTDEDFPERLPKDKWIDVDVITIAAPDLRTKSNIHAAIVGGGTHMNDAELFGYHVKRAIHMLTCAASMGAEALVLGAFGCGAFENNPEVVARAYKVALQEFPNVFKQIEFAVYCSPKDSKNYDIFKKVLG